MSSSGAHPQAMLSVLGVRPLGLSHAPHQEPAHLVMPWSATGFEVRFCGPKLDVRLSQAQADSDLGPAISFWQVTIDGQKTCDLKILPGPAALYTLAQGLGEGPHTATVLRRSEAQLGATTLHDVQVASGHLLPPLPHRGRTVLVMGDSITAGFGALCANEHDIAKACNEDGLATYAALAAQDVGADLQVLAWSGRGVWRNGDGSFIATLPALWAQAQKPVQTPDAIVMNVGTNDFRRPDVDAQAFVASYDLWLAALRSAYPHAHIFLAVGPMLTDAYPPGAHALSRAQDLVAEVYAHQTAHGAPKMHLLAFTTQDGAQGFGCAYHPNVATHRRMAQTLSAALRITLGW